MSSLDDYYRNNGVDQFGGNMSGGASTSGLPQGSVTNTYNPAVMGYTQFDSRGEPTGSGYVQRKASTTSTYNGEGGRWTNSGQGWTDDTGLKVGDLGGYLKMKGLQKTGSDFSQEQNQLTGLLNDPSKIQQTAGYQFDVDQGNQAINRSAAAKGSLNSGGVLAELAKYGQGMASKEYGDQANRLAGIIGQKQNFGASNGYYEKPQNTGWSDVPGTMGAKSLNKASTW